jgi:hypothetical protein
MITLALTALAGTLACTAPEDTASCFKVTEVSTRVRTHRRSCSGLQPIEKLYSVNVEGWLVCLPLNSIVAGPAAVRTPGPDTLKRTSPPEPIPPAPAPAPAPGK